MKSHKIGQIIGGILLLLIQGVFAYTYNISWLPDPNKLLDFVITMGLLSLAILATLIFISMVLCLLICLMMGVAMAKAVGSDTEGGPRAVVTWTSSETQSRSQRTQKPAREASAAV